MLIYLHNIFANFFEKIPVKSKYLAKMIIIWKGSNVI